MTLILLTIALGVMSGISEGMVMIQPGDKMHSGRAYPLFPVHIMYQSAGVREHIWSKWYHQIDIAAYLLCAALAIKLWTNPPHLLTIIGISILLWETREIGYNYARYRTVLAESENVYGLGIEIQRRGVIIIHATRSLLSLALLYGGLR